jgi:hypothetical protein
VAELKFDIIPENAPLFAADIVASAKSIDGVTLDYSVKSLEIVDRIIGGFHEEGKTVEEMAATVFGFGCYVGGVFVKNVGATWRAATQEEIENIYGVPLIVQLKNQVTANPIGKVIKRLENGDEDNIPYFYRGITRAANEHSGWFTRVVERVKGLFGR